MYNRRLETLIEAYINTKKEKVISCESNGSTIDVECDKKTVNGRTYSGMKYTIYKEDFKIFLDKKGYKNIILEDLLIASALNQLSNKHKKQMSIFFLIGFVALVIVNVMCKL